MWELLNWCDLTGNMGKEWYRKISKTFSLGLCPRKKYCSMFWLGKKIGQLVHFTQGLETVKIIKINWIINYFGQGVTMMAFNKKINKLKLFIHLAQTDIYSRVNVYFLAHSCTTK